MNRQFFRKLSFITCIALLTVALGQPVLAAKKDQLQKDAAANQEKLDQAEAEADSIESEKGLAEEELAAAQEQLVNLIASSHT